MLKILENKSHLNACCHPFLCECECVVLVKQGLQLMWFFFACCTGLDETDSRLAGKTIFARGSCFGRPEMLRSLRH